MCGCASACTHVVQCARGIARARFFPFAVARPFRARPPRLGRAARGCDPMAPARFRGRRFASLLRVTLEEKKKKRKEKKKKKEKRNICHAIRRPPARARECESFPGAAAARRTRARARAASRTRTPTRRRGPSPVARAGASRLVTHSMGGFVWTLKTDPTANDAPLRARARARADRDWPRAAIAIRRRPRERKKKKKKRKRQRK